MAVFTLLATLVLRSGGGTVLDIGCGPGWWTGFVAQQDVDGLGVDISPEMVRIARDNNPDARFEIGSLLGLPAEDATAAAPVCWFVLHHLPDEDVDAALAEMTRALKPGGVLLIGGTREGQPPRQDRRLWRPPHEGPAQPQPARRVGDATPGAGAPSRGAPALRDR